MLPSSIFGNYSARQIHRTKPIQNTFLLQCFKIGMKEDNSSKRQKIESYSSLISAECIGASTSHTLPCSVSATISVSCNKRETVADKSSHAVNKLINYKLANRYNNNQ